MGPWQVRQVTQLSLAAGPSLGPDEMIERVTVRTVEMKLVTSHDTALQ
jgi:hypothetical protein